ncbi:hypothetical protein [Alloactinosynnema sp. L-07]|nr:hypothetical protein [Alloactinosynnema sp. L-07]CRK60538.1 hypothetical protein [Alloactinosynnema sp. L-07]
MESEFGPFGREKTYGWSGDSWGLATGIGHIDTTFEGRAFQIW